MYQQIKILALGAVEAMSLGTGAVPKKITVFVYNYAATPSEVLVQTEAEAARIYQLGGIEIQWLNCPLSPQEVDQFPACQVAPGPTKLALRILSQSMAERVRQAEDSFGFAMFPEDESFAIIANVFSHDAEALAHRHGMRHGLVLGHLVAHELGHLLLGAGSHSSQGIMHVPWGVKELDMIRRRSMVFTSREAERMRTNIAARTAIARASHAASHRRVMIKQYDGVNLSLSEVSRAEREAQEIFPLRWNPECVDDRTAG